MKKLTYFILTAAAAVLTPAMCQTSPEISIKVLHCLTDGSGAPEICALSNVKRIEIEVTFNPKGNDNLKRLGEIPLNPTGTMPRNYIIIRAVDAQSGTNLPVRVAAYGNGGKAHTENVDIYLEILEDAAVRQNKMQTSVNQIKAEDLASGKASQQLIDKLTHQNAGVIEALDRYYIENRLGRFKLSVEYHSTQSRLGGGQL